MYWYEDLMREMWKQLKVESFFKGEKINVVSHFRASNLGCEEMMLSYGK
jgi:hypothetical protein